MLNRKRRPGHGTGRPITTLGAYVQALRKWLGAPTLENESRVAWTASAMMESTPSARALARARRELLAMGWTEPLPRSIQLRTEDIDIVAAALTEAAAQIRKGQAEDFDSRRPPQRLLLTGDVTEFGGGSK